MTVHKDLNELVNAGVISPDTASDISAYYQKNKPSKEQRLFLIFGILGSLLVGLGIILVIAHNWDQLPRLVKTLLSFVPLILAQVLCGYALVKKTGVVAWKESSSTLLFFAVGASIALVSQIYHITGDLEGFMLTWMLLALPIVYVMRSSMTSLLYLVGITYYLFNTHSILGRWENINYYWFLLLAVLPYYWSLSKHHFQSNFAQLHHWMVPLSIVFWLLWSPGNYDPIRVLASFGVFSVFYFAGDTAHFRALKKRHNGYSVIGMLGLISYLLLFTFEDSWPSFRTSETYDWKQFIPFGSILIIVSLGIAAFLRQRFKVLPFKFHPLDWAFVSFVLLLLISYLGNDTVAASLTNVVVFVLGIYYIVTGSKDNRLDLVNFGFIIISVLIACRFFDTDLSFLLRGGMFILVGISFFISNYNMLKKRKEHV